VARESMPLYHPIQNEKEVLIIAICATEAGRQSECHLTIEWRMVIAIMVLWKII
jgi:hypothetical protein